MDTQLLQLARQAPTLEIDFVGDLACPWSYLSLKSLGRALDSLYGLPARTLRWHGLPQAGLLHSDWRPHLATRVPQGADLDQVQADLATAGRMLGIEFAFGGIQRLPDTREAHRLVHLAAAEGRGEEVVEVLFRGFFERGLDIAHPLVLAQLAREAGVSEATGSAFSVSAAGRDEIVAEERRLRGLGVAAVPQLIINGRVMVPGTADVSTYIQALDQAVFPDLPAPQGRRQLH
jgi:predicted DsbA family dithiol-disulfide isomerase